MNDILIVNCSENADSEISSIKFNVAIQKVDGDGEFYEKDYVMTDEIGFVRINYSAKNLHTVEKKNKCRSFLGVSTMWHVYSS